MGIESRNNFLNKFRWKYGHQGIILATINAKIFMLSANWKCLQYWTKEKNTKIPLRKQPKYKSFAEIYPKEFEELSVAYHSIFSLDLFDNLCTASDGKNHLITICECNEKELKKEIFDEMLKNDLRFDKNNLSWTPNHRASMWTVLQKYNVQYIDNDVCNNLFKFFNKIFTVKFLWKQCREMGFKWQTYAHATKK